MTMYFDQLPIELRSELLKFLPRSYLLTRGPDLSIKYKIPYMFSFNCFKACDTNDFWMSLYKSNYIVDTVYNLTESQTTVVFKDIYRESYVCYVYFSLERLKYAMKNGHNWILWKETQKYHGIWLDFDELFLVAVKYLQWNCMYEIDLSYTLKTATYQKALNMLACKNILECNLEFWEQWIDVLLDYGAEFPKIYHFGDRIGFVTVYIDKKTLDDGRFLKYLVKYNAIPDVKKLVESLILMNINLETLVDFINTVNLVIGDDIFKYALRPNKLIYIKLFIDRGYKVTANDIHVAAKCDDREIFDYVLAVYTNK